MITILLNENFWRNGAIILFYFCHANINETKMINTDLLRADGKYNVTEFLVECSKYVIWSQIYPLKMPWMF